MDAHIANVFWNMAERVRFVSMTDIHPQLIELAHQMNDALGRARKRRDRRMVSSPEPQRGLLIPPMSKAEQDERHAELVRTIEEDLKRS